MRCLCFSVECVVFLRRITCYEENGENEGHTKQETDHVSVQDSDVATSLIPAVEEDAQEERSPSDNSEDEATQEDL